MAPANHKQTSRKPHANLTQTSRKPQTNLLLGCMAPANHTQTSRKPNIGVFGSRKPHANLTQTSHKPIVRVYGCRNAQYVTSNYNCFPKDAQYLMICNYMELRILCSKFPDNVFQYIFKYR